MSQPLTLNGITSEEAYDIINGIVYLSKQVGLDSTTENNLIKLGKKTSRQFEEYFNWVNYEGKRERVFEYLLKKKINVKIRKS